MITLGLILVLVAVFLEVPAIIGTIGMILLIAGVVLWILGAFGRAIGPRPHYW